MRGPTWRRNLLLVLLAGAGLNCGREITGPGSVRVARGFSFVPQFVLGDMPASVASELVPFERVRVILRNALNEVVVDRDLDFPSSANEVSLSLDVPLSSETGASGEQMALSLAYVNAQGDTVFRGAQTVTVAPRDPRNPAPPAEIPVVYAGPGANATAVQITPRADTVVAGDPFSFSAQAVDGQSPIAAPIAWRSLEPTIANVATAAAGDGTALPSRGTARIVAQLLTGPADTVSLVVLPLASTLSLESGGSQTANPSTPLPNPVVVRVNATDGLGVEGVVVTFAPSGDGDVNTSSAVTDANGLAEVLWTLGSDIGAQTLTATATGLTGSPLAISATAAELPLTLLHHYTFDDGLADAVGGANGTLFGEAGIFDGVLSLDGVSGYVELPGRLVPNTGSYSVSLFVRSGPEPSGTQTYLSQGETEGPSLAIARTATSQIVVSDALVPSASAPNADDLFHHVALVVNAAAGTTTIWIDGVQVETYFAALERSDAGTNTRLGRGVGSGGLYFGGEIDEVRIYQGALSAGDIASLYASGVSAPGFLEFDVEPSDAEVGSVIAPPIRVRALDALGRIRTTGVGSVALSIDVGPPSAQLLGTLSRAAVAGIATFDDIAIDTEGSFVLEASSAGSQSAFSDLFSITPTASLPTQLAFFTQPVDGDAGSPLSAVVVEIRDAGGQRVMSATNEITVALGNNPSGATLLGQLTAVAVDGRATFSDLEIDVAGSGYTLVAGADGLDGAESDPFSVTGAGATQLRFVLQPISTVAGATLATVSVEARTALDVVDPDFTGAVTIALGANPGSATLGGTLTVNAIAGVASFSTLTVSAAAAGYTLVATAAGLTNATSEEFSITTGAFTNAWTNPAGGTWSLASNWSLGRAPIASDTVLIALDGTYTVTMDANFSGSLVIVGGGTGAQTLSTDTRTLSVANELRIEPTGVLLQRGQVSGAGTMLVNGRLDARGASTIQTDLVVSPGAVVEIRSNAVTSSATLTVNQGFTNAGRIELVAVDAGYSTQLTVLNGTLVNAASGVIRSVPGTGARTLAAEVDNQGTFELDFPLNLSRSGAQHVNSGTIPLGAANLAITQTGTGASFTNLGLISLAPGRTLTVTGGSVDFLQGVVSGDSGVVALTGGVSLLLDAASTGPRFSFGSGTTLAAPYTIAVGDSVRFSSGTLGGAALTVEGELVALGSFVLNAPLITTPSSRITVRSASVTSNATFTSASGFTVEGVLDLIAVDAGYTSAVVVTSGTLVIAADATLLSSAGTGSRLVNAALQNDGEIVLNHPLAINRPAVQHINRGTIALETQNLSVTQSGLDAEFVNEGIITIGAGRQLTVTGGTLDLVTGTLTGESGTLSVNNLTLRTSPASVRTRYLLGTTTTIADPYTIPAGDSLKIIGGTWTGPGLTIEGRLIASGTTTLAAPVTTTAAGVFEARSSSEAANGSVTVSSGFTNVGLIELTSANAGYTTTLAVPNGTLVNEATGVLRSVAGTGARVLAAELDNRGVVELLHPLTINRAASQHVNSGSIALTTQNLTVTQTGASPNFANTGTITLDAGRTLTVTGGTLDLGEGLLSGEGATLSLTNVSLIATPTTMRTRLDFNTGSSLASAYTIPVGDSLKVLGGTLTAPGLTLQGRFIGMGTTTVNAPVTTTATGAFEARSSSEGASGSITVVNGFSNVGLIEMTAANAGYTTTLTVTNGTLVNEAAGVLRSVAGTGSRVLAAQLDNRGTLELLHPLTLNRASAQHLNSGTIPLTVSNMTITQTGSAPTFTNTGTITLNAGRTLTVSGGTLDLGEGLLSGEEATLALTNVSLVAVPTTMRTRLDFNTGTSFASAYTIPAGDSLKVLGGTLTAPGLTLQGRFIGMGTTTINTPVTTTASGVFEARSSSEGASGSITVVNGFANIGLIELTATDAGYATTLTVTNGTLVNEATGILRSVAGTGSRVLAAQLDNRGAIELLHPLNINRASAQHLNSGTIPLTTSNLTITQTGTSPTFTNTGTITLDAGRTLTVSGGTLDLDEGLVSGEAATLALTNVTLLATPTTVRTRYSLNSGTSFVNAYTIPAGDSLKVLGGTLNAPGLTLQGRFIGMGTTTVAAPVTTTASGVFEARSSSEAASGSITVVNGFANTGLIELTATDAGYTTTLTVTNGTLVNEATGILRSVAGTGARVLAAELDNRGSLELPHALTINRASAQHLNSGTIPLTSSNLTITQTGSTPSFTNTGSITLADARTLTISGGTANLGSGTLLGVNATLALSGTTLNLTPGSVRARISFGAGSSLGGAYTVPAGDTLRLAGGTLAGPALTINGNLLVLATSTISAPLTTGTSSEIELRSSGFAASTNLTIPSSWTNNGALLFNVLDANYTTTLTMTGQTLTNAATGTIDFVTGNNSGTRTFAGATLDNFGTVLVNRLTNVNATFEQRGQFTVNAPHTANVQTLALQPGSSTTVNGVLNVTTCNALGGSISGAGTGTWTTACP